ncbi:TPA: hypothetical protein N0F65_004199 [Lagenidium giganteum]|uniref:Uncharacterized protein n=1 Tax=Lagenidium giganteum TaxID=4803 RepID=A0AAV2YG70_9STRA|nr:TPA: hypothetical protein N0F65_004199 [Lagenidium giganteum]
MSLPPTTNSPIFNSSFFLGSNDYLTIAVADKRYQKIGGTGVFSSLAVAGNLDCGSLTIAGSAVDLTSLSGVTAGTVTASKVVMVDVNKDISSFRNLPATNLTGTLQTAAQPNITSVGTLSSLTVSGNISGTLSTGAQPNITSVGTLTSLTVSGALNGTLSTAAQPNITSLGTLTSLTVSGSLNITSTGNLTLPASLTISNGTTPISCTNTTSTSTFAISIQSAGGAQDIGSTTAHQVAIRTNGTRRLTCDTSGNVDAVAHNGSTVGLKLGGTLVTATATQLNYNTVTPGTAAASKTLVIDSAGDIYGIDAIGLNNIDPTNNSALLYKGILRKKIKRLVKMVFRFMTRNSIPRRSQF